MNNPASKHQHPLVTWVLIADGKQAHIYGCRKAIHQIPLGGANKHHYYDEKSGFELVPVPGGILEADSIDNYQIGHDRRGTASSSNSPTHNTFEPHGDIEGELKKQFSKTIANKLQHALTEKIFDRLVLVAPAEMIGEFRKHLTADVQGRIVAVLPKDLAHLQGQILMTHLSDILTQAHVE